MGVERRVVAMEDVQSELLARVRPVQTTQSCALADSVGRVLAQTLVSPMDVPSFDNSAMDGYALHVADVATPGRFQVVQRILAGQNGTALYAGQAARIMTGAAIPPGCDVVVPQEDVQRHGDWVETAIPLNTGQHIRRRGEDIAVGQTVLKQGTRLEAKHVGLAASVGLSALEVYVPLKVGMFFTGDELLEPGQPLRPGMIYNSNRYVLGGLLRALGCVVTDYGVVSDDPHAIQTMLLQASADNNVVLTSGGVSVGEADHVTAAVEQLGRLHMWQIAMKPGKPFAFGQIGLADFVGLPGNPVSAYVTFMLLAAPFLKRLQGRLDCLPVRLRVPAGFTWMRHGRVREFVRVTTTHDAEGRFCLALISAKQGAAVMTSITQADGLAEVPAGTHIHPGDWVWYYPFAEG